MKDEEFEKFKIYLRAYKRGQLSERSFFVRARGIFWKPVPAVKR